MVLFLDQQILYMISVTLSKIFLSCYLTIYHIQFCISNFRWFSKFKFIVEPNQTFLVQKQWRNIWSIFSSCLRHIWQDMGHLTTLLISSLCTGLITLRILHIRALTLGIESVFQFFFPNDSFISIVISFRIIFIILVDNPVVPWFHCVITLSVTHPH